MSTMMNIHDTKSSRASRSVSSAAGIVTYPPEPGSSRVLVPNALTLDAMRSAERKAFGLKPNDSPVFSSADSVMAFLEA